MATIREQVDLKLASCEMNGDKITDYFEAVKLEDAKDFDNQLKLEIVYWGNYEISYEVTSVERKYASNHANDILKDSSIKQEDGIEYIPDLYFIDKTTSQSEEISYLYDMKVDEIYKIKLTKIGRWKVHSIVELEYQQGHETERTEKEGTLITDESSLVTLENGVTCYGPELKGFVKEKTKAIYYKTNAAGEIVDNDNPEERPIIEYLQSKNRIIEKENSKYVFYNYNETQIDETTGKVKNLNSIWANIKVEGSGINTYWVWIPRYAYKLNGEETDIIYIKTDNTNASTGEAIPSDYIVHTAFVENNKKGIWVSKYEASQVATKTTLEFPCYIPDLTGFDRENTYIEEYKDDGTFVEKPLKDITNIQEYAKTNRWFDYEQSIWANIKTVSYGGAESWWVWIPRYAYNLSGETTTIMFVDTRNKPLSGEDLPSNYVVHPAFTVTEDGKTKELKGIWASKYEATQPVVDMPTTNDVNVPDLSGFNSETTWIEVYKDDGTFAETKLADVGNIEQFVKSNRWYDYSKQIWANIKTEVDGVRCWWVWIPRYAYNITGEETRIIFLDENGNPRDGKPLPANYVPHPAFEGKKGIWVSKYEATEVN